MKSLMLAIKQIFQLNTNKMLQFLKDKATQLTTYLNIICLGLDILLIFLCLFFLFFTMSSSCLVSFFLYYLIFYGGQVIQHFLIFKIPKIDVIAYDQIIKKNITIVSMIEVSYLFLAIIFWQKAEIHPIYCALCIQMDLPLAIGGAIIVHFVISLYLFINFLHIYIGRKYYLLALGGFDVEVRLNRERQDSLRRVYLIEPDLNYDPISHISTNNKKDKYYQFEDIQEDVQGEEVCSICLNKRQAQLHPIYTSCRHFFHRECIENWAKINSKCPECRREFKEIYTHNEAVEQPIEGTEIVGTLIKQNENNKPYELNEVNLSKQQKIMNQKQDD